MNKLLLANFLTSLSILTLCLFSSRALTRSTAAGVSATGAFLCLRRRDRGEGAAEAGAGEGVGGMASVLAETASAANNLKPLPRLLQLLLLAMLLVDAVRADARRAIRSLAEAPPPPLLPPPTTERSAAIAFFFLEHEKKKK